MDTPKLAKRDAAVQTIRQLYNAKELDEHLAPSVGGGLDYGFEEEHAELKEERKILDAGTNRRKQQYDIKVSCWNQNVCFLDCKVYLLYLYVFHAAGSPVVV